MNVEYAGSQYEVERIQSINGKDIITTKCGLSFPASSICLSSNKEAFLLEIEREKAIYLKKRAFEMIKEKELKKTEAGNADKN